MHFLLLTNASLQNADSLNAIPKFKFYTVFENFRFEEKHSAWQYNQGQNKHLDFDNMHLYLHSLCEFTMCFKFVILRNVIFTDF